MKAFALSLFAVLYVLLLCASTPQMLHAAPQDREAVFQKQVAPLLKKHCVQCHNADDSEGEFDLTQYATASKIVEGRNKWLRAASNIQHQVMPPDGEPQLSKDQREFLSAWIREAANDIDCSGGGNPGQVTIRRLNRNEYRNTVRDLVGVDYEPAEDFPADDVGYGFDNIGDVLSLPPLLMEKYMKAAQEISEQAIQLNQPAGEVNKRQLAGYMQASGGSSRVGLADRVLTTSGEMWFEYPFPHDGEYKFRVRAYADQAGDEPAKMTLRVDGKDMQTIDVKAVEDKPGIYDARFRVSSGRRKLAIAFINDFYDPNNSNRSRRDRNLYASWVEIYGPVDFKPEPKSASHRNIIFVTPTRSLPAADAARKVLMRLMSLAYRRPAAKDEVDRLMKIWQQVYTREKSYEKAVQVAMSALLVSPHFLFKVEQPAPAGKIRKLNDYELASSLSYFLWSSMPDRELIDTAWTGGLQNDATLEKQVRRMLKNPRVFALVRNFAAQWLQLRLLEEVTPDGKRFPHFTPELRAAMKRETELFVSSIIAEDRNVLDLLRADYTFVNQELAEHYGMQSVKGKEFRKVSTETAGRGGLLTQASILTVTSDATRTSPVKRGKWILDNLLNDPPPPPAPDVPPLENQEELKGTLRQRMEQHRADPGCASCHRRMDPLGFALEHFDATGRYRQKDGGDEIDASGELPGGAKFDGANELKKVLATTYADRFVRCLAEKLLTYALGRGLKYYDKCAVDQIVAEAADNGNTFSAMVLAVVRSVPFSQRKGE